MKYICMYLLYLQFKSGCGNRQINPSQTLINLQYTCTFNYWKSLELAWTSDPLRSNRCVFETALHLNSSQTKANIHGWIHTPVLHCDISQGHWHCNISPTSIRASYCSGSKSPSMSACWKPTVGFPVISWSWPSLVSISRRFITFSCLSSSTFCCFSYKLRTQKHHTNKSITLYSQQNSNITEIISWETTRYIFAISAAPKHIIMKTYAGQTRN